MGRRRQRHFNPATAGCAAVFDGRFGISYSPSPFPNGTGTWNGRTGSLHGASGSGGGSATTINGQGSYLSGSGTLYIGTNPYGAGPTVGMDITTSNCSVFVCARNDSTGDVSEYGRIIGVYPDTSAFYGSREPGWPTRGPTYVASFFGNGVATWNDLNQNSPTVSADAPFAACFSNSGTSCNPTSNTTTQTAKTVTSVSANASTLTGLIISGNQYAFSQYFRGAIGMIAISATKLSTPVERRILQMMGRVWRIHTL